MMVIFGVSVLYSILIFSFVFGWLKLKKYETSQNFDIRNICLSVIIAAKNEEATLGSLLSDIENQSLDKKYFELILVDDCSTDSTLSVLNLYKDKFPKILILQTDFGKTGKKKRIAKSHKFGIRRIYCNNRRRLQNRNKVA